MASTSSSSSTPSSFTTSSPSSSSSFSSFIHPPLPTALPDNLSTATSTGPRQSLLHPTFTISPSTPTRVATEAQTRAQTQKQAQEAGPSQRYLFFAVRSGHKPGVYTDWYDAERQLLNYPNPTVKTFSTRLAAEAFVAGWNGAGRHSLPPTTPRPLREHLAMSFPGSVNVPYSPPRRQSYHARLLAAVPPPSDEDFEFGTLTPRPRAATDVRPGPRPTSASFRHSMVKISSPLRQEVDEDPLEELAGDSTSRLPPLRKAASYMGMGGLLSPPTSPEHISKRLSIMDRERPTKSRGVSETGQWSSRGHRDFASGTGLGLVSPPNSPPASAADKRTSISGKPSRPSPRVSGLWADAIPVSAPAPSPNTSRVPGAELFGDNTAPKFSRAGMRKSGVIMPVAAKRSSTTSLRSNPSRTSLLSPSANSSSSSLVSNTSSGSEKTVRRSTSTYTYSQDRLSSLAETSRRELQLNEEGLSALDSLSPPRPAFMRRTPSSSSIASSDSIGSMGSLTSASSQASSDSFGPINEAEEYERERDSVAGEAGQEMVVGEVEVMISCTKSDGDADGSVDSGSMKDVRVKTKGPGGMFKRFAKALKLEKKSDALRRGSL